MSVNTNQIAELLAREQARDHLRVVDEEWRANHTRNGVKDRIIFLRSVATRYGLDGDIPCSWDEVMDAMDALVRTKSLHEAEWVKVVSPILTTTADFLKENMPKDGARNTSRHQRRRDLVSHQTVVLGQIQIETEFQRAMESWPDMLRRGI